MDAQYHDHALVALYDRLNAGAEDLDFYRARLGGPPARVLDLGCGTGAFALRLAAEGFGVTGADPAGAMLDVARSRDPGRSVTWVNGGAGDLPADARFDVATMTGHAFQCLLDDRETAAVLGAVRARLVPGGRLLFETRNPAGRAWERWTPAASARSVLDDHGRSVRVWHELSSVAGDLVSFRTTYRWPGSAAVSASTLRFPSRDAVDGALRAAGFARVTLFGGWDGSAWAATSPEIIVEAAA